MTIQIMAALCQLQGSSAQTEPVYVNFRDQAKGVFSRFELPGYGRAQSFRIRPKGAAREVVITLAAPLPNSYSGRFIADIHYSAPKGLLFDKTLVLCLGKSVVYGAGGQRVGPNEAALLDGSQKVTCRVSHRTKGAEISITEPEELRDHEVVMGILRVVPPSIGPARLLSLAELHQVVFQSERLSGRSVVVPPVYDTGPP
ncbi:MAG TPA: hypothetical protein VEX38_02290 [Fimbriimonadaceae bacterium]|nr:hypothetical protein [Fimbriimonadaceae bacterium]